jgi:hypothetical protein
LVVGSSAATAAATFAVESSVRVTSSAVSPSKGARMRVPPARSSPYWRFVTLLCVAVSPPASVSGAIVGENSTNSEISRITDRKASRQLDLIRSIIVSPHG